MDQTLPPRLPANLESAVQRVRMAARSAAEQTVDSLGLAALATHGVLQRDALLGAQFELNRKLAIFALTFNEALDTSVAREAGTLTPSSGPGQACPSPDDLVASWDQMSLVDDHEMELHISADRFALEIGHTCEWEIRELDAYMGTLMGLVGTQHDRNPLRAELVGQAMIRAIEAVADRPEVRKVLSTEIGRSLAQAMRQTYADIVGDLRHQGIKPMGLTVRQTGPRSHSGHGALATANADEGPASGAGPLHALSASGRLSTRPGALASGRAVLPGGVGGGAGGGAGGVSGHGATLGQVEASMMSLIRRLTMAPAEAHGGWGDAGAPGLQAPHSQAGQAGGAGHWHNGPHDGTPDGGHDGMGHITQVLQGAPMGADAWAGYQGQTADGHAMAAPNLILAYRDELRQAAGGALDHMVIDVIGSLFEQILSDPKVPPQMARQIARLQLPVLRAALGDNSFFSSRKHPVRRFVNRIASLGSAVDDFDGTDGRALLVRVADLVQEVVDGDFEQIGLYEQKLQALEAFVADQAQAQVRALGQADAVLARKETELRIQHQFAQELEAALQAVPVPDYLRDFLAGTWSKVIASAQAQGEPGQALALAMRDTGRELLLSVQPKGTPALRQAFLRRLPQLMKDLNTGLDRVRCPEGVRRDFFAQLLPAHAESLKGQPLSTLESNLLSRQVEGVLATPLPAAERLMPVSPALTQSLAAEVVFSPAEAQAVGLVDEQSVDWNGEVDIDLGAEPELAAVDIDIDGLPPPEPMEPSRGKGLADHVQLGFAYQMHLHGQWQKVRLTHVSASRGFFVFTHGEKQRRTLSLTYRMLTRLCESNRLRAFENAYLLERATARARAQLAALMPGSATGRRGGRAADAQ